jgi:hypothetical protein
MRILLLALFLLPSVALAAPFELRGTESEDGSWTLELMLSATSTSVNAVEGTLQVGEVTDLYTGSSVVQNWLEAPRLENGLVRFAGIIPGGFVGTASAGSGLSGPGTLFTFSTNGSPSVRLEDGFLYLNDGQGTKIAIEEQVLTVSGAATREQEEDRTPPEYIDADPVEDERVAEGRYALLLSAFDAASGIDYFEVQEGKGPWTRSDGTYVVEDTSGFKDLHVRAYDRAGNFLEILVPGKNSGILSLAYALLALILVLGVIALTVYLQKKRRRS